ncbi:MAG: sulfotransferase [Ketobacter sp.]|nr:sulfotransferase [Ketobacter sp.]
MNETIARPNWYDALNEIANHLGGAEVISDLSPESLAKAGGGEFIGEAPFEALIRSLREEADLSGVGAILARTEIIRAIRARLALSKASSKHFFSQYEVIKPSKLKPLFIIGGARSGTSALLRHLVGWPDVRAPFTVEILCPETIGSDQIGTELVQSVTLQDRVWDLLEPSFTSQHLNRGDLPSECLPILNCGFQSHHWTGCYRVPSYSNYLAGSKFESSLSFHQVFASCLAVSAKGQLLVFKSPAYALIVSLILKAYPGARFVFIHRDPVKVASSHARLLATLRRMRSRNVNSFQSDVSDAIEHVEETYISLCRAIDSGKLHHSNLKVFSYEQLLTNVAKLSSELRSWLQLPKLPKSGGCDISQNSLERLEPVRKLPRVHIDSEAQIKLRQCSKEFMELYWGSEGI